MRFVVACALVCALFGAQSSIGQIVQNPGFDTTLAPWWEIYGNDIYWGPTPHGTAEWSSAYGGSAHLVVSGGPCGVGLLNFTQAVINPGDYVGMRIYHTDFGNFAGITFNVAFPPDYGQSSGQHQCPGPGPCDVGIVADRVYPTGTAIWTWFCAWPGSADVWVDEIVSTGVAESGELKGRSTSQVVLKTPIPNPSRGGSTAIRFALPAERVVSLKIYDSAGKLIKTLASGVFEAGDHIVVWDGRDEARRKLASGPYFCRLEAGSLGTTTKMVLLP